MFWEKDFLGRNFLQHTKKRIIQIWNQLKEIDHPNLRGVGGVKLYTIWELGRKFWTFPEFWVVQFRIILEILQILKTEYLVRQSPVAFDISKNYNMKCKKVQKKAQNSSSILVFWLCYLFQTDQITSKNQSTLLHSNQKGTTGCGRGGYYLGMWRAPLRQERDLIQR